MGEVVDTRTAVTAEPDSASNPVPRVTQHSSATAKIALFRSLFRGREDVYPRRFENRRSGRSGYSPACGNEWVRGVCEKPRIKCADCPHQRFLPVTEDVVRWHLSGHDPQGKPFVMGIYPMLRDETCYFLAADFDGDGWQEDVRAFELTCRRLNIPVAVERSRSGQGGHVWFFFSEAVPAALARKLGSYVLTETMEVRPELGLRSYDRLFPNQDTLPQGGFGNLIALPLQREARDRGHSVFLDASHHPCPDQWAFLDALPRISRPQMEAVVRDADSRGRVVGVRFVPADEGEDDSPWTAPPSRRRRDEPLKGPLPARLDLVLGDQIYFPKDQLTPGLRNRLVRLAAFQNPEFYRAQSMRLPTYDKPRIVACAEDSGAHISLPRGCLEEVQQLLDSLKIKTNLRDTRFAGRPLETSFRGDLRPEQKAAAEALRAHDTGVLAATTAFGKTVIAAWLIAARGVNTLVLVHLQQLQEQWIDRLSAFLDLPPKSIGRLGGGKRPLTGIIDVALVQSLVRHGVVNDVVADYGHVVVDECHHLSAASFELVARRTQAKYVTGLSATVTRKDGHHPIVFMQCGPIRYRVNARQQAAARPFGHQVIVRPTGFRAMVPPDPDVRVEFQQLSQALSVDEPRNSAICQDVVEAMKEGRTPLILTERTDHLDRLAERLRPAVPRMVILRGGLGRPAMKEALAEVGKGAEAGGRVILATGRFIGEGFDDPRLDTLFLTLPVSWRGTIAQYVGRLHRLCEGKRVVRVYDYADLDVPMLSRMFDRRCRGYESVGYSILLPASALPGWPADVPLPVDPEWKRDYAASVRRLIRDGVDEPLGRLFVHAAVRTPPDRPGSDHARSASEAFLHRRLETLTDTAGRFRMNAVLPISFDGWGQMEVDFLEAEARVVLELDGPQHLADAEAYRRDRRKDALLQENGFCVLRFLAEDLAGRLDEVLDRILRTLAHRRRTNGVAAEGTRRTESL